MSALMDSTRTLGVPGGSFYAERSGGGDSFVNGGRYPSRTATWKRLRLLLASSSPPFSSSSSFSSSSPSVSSTKGRHQKRQYDQVPHTSPLNTQSQHLTRALLDGGSTITDCNLDSDLSSDISSSNIVTCTGRMSEYQVRTPWVTANEHSDRYLSMTHLQAECLYRRAGSFFSLQLSKRRLSDACQEPPPLVTLRARVSISGY